MVDTHCHLLPGLDDGPATEEESLTLGARLAADGITHVVATPHHSRRWPTDHGVASAALERLRTRFAHEGLPLRLSLAAEIAPAQAVQAPADALRARALGGRYLLVEAEPTTPAGFFAALVDRLAPLGLVPVIGHPERCRALRRAPALLDGPRRDGALVQIVACSLVGDSGGEVRASAWRLLGAGRADLVASDAHDVRRRPPRMSDAAELVERRLGGEAVRALFLTQPARLVADPVAARESGSAGP
jgi:protein-tyrosine phosphatase